MTMLLTLNIIKDCCIASPLDQFGADSDVWNTVIASDLFESLEVYINNLIPISSYMDGLISVAGSLGLIEIVNLEELFITLLATGGNLLFEDGDASTSE